MKRVEKHNLLKKGDLSRKRERLKGSGGRVDIPESMKHYEEVEREGVELL